ncbi:Y-family DNA polymerase [Corynebacterium choanae]|uniref:DNA polymerase IV n=1 Tax=Corynebacterium choanae TaxID=1862358 RepID=A0A3G6J803_9CORY|nr:DNA polymerase Y family protein [Corynebacterium choanae]AZA14235.1 DNA polymerase IV [Corynebacterium choanae]
MENSSLPDGNITLRASSKLALWFPDWPVQAVHLQQQHPATAVIAVSGQGRARHTIAACGASARQQGIARGMNIRAAQALCPDLVVCPWDESRDYAAFETVVAALEDVVASLEILRPGLVVVDIYRAARFWGGLDHATQRLLDAASLPGIDLRCGLATTMTTALLAARANRLLQPSDEQQFLAEQPITQLLAETALEVDPTTVGQLYDVGVRTCGDLTAIDAAAVTTRFGQPGMRCYTIAAGNDQRRVHPALPQADFTVTYDCPQPITRVDEAAFLARSLADRLHTQLSAAAMVCQRLQVTMECRTPSGEITIERLWRTREPLTETTTADRIRWQLDTWLTKRGVHPQAVVDAQPGKSDEQTGDDSGLWGITSIVLSPVEISAPDHGEGLFAQHTSNSSQAAAAVNRVQTLLGIEAVEGVYHAGGISPVERLQTLPWGEAPADKHTSQVSRRWAGKIPAPLPAARVDRTLSTNRVVLLDAAGREVFVTVEALLAGRPVHARYCDQEFTITGWAGPWPVDTLWWTAQPQRLARLQISGHEQEQPAALFAWLLVWQNNMWQIEASYC